MMRQPDRAPRKARVDPPLLLAFLLPVFAVAPLAHPGYFELRSGFLPIFALTDRLARLGELTWTPAVGTAHSLAIGDGILPYWLAALPAAFGAAPFEAVKWVMAISLVTGSVGAFLWLRGKWADGWPALVGAAVYVLNPFTLSLAYREGAFAAVVLLGLLPWTLGAADRVSRGRWPAAIGFAVFVGAAIWTQAALGLAQAAILAAYILLTRSSDRLRKPLAALVAGIALGGLLWLPALLAKGPGVTEALPFTAWLVLGLPWLALAVGWVAARLDAMLSPDEASIRPALFASLLTLVALVATSQPPPTELRTPIPSAPLAIFGDNELALISVKTEGTPGPGGRVAVEAIWQALRPLDRDYTVFFHAVGPDGQRYGQQDGMPLDGQTPTSGWQPGRRVTDRREAVLSPDAPIEGPYQYWLGLYDAQTGLRLAAGTDDKVVFPPESKLQQ
jgi:hypothetical protein